MKERRSITNRSTNFSLSNSYLRPSRILLHSFEGFGIIHVSSIDVELERLKIWLAHMQFSQSATLPTLVCGPTSHTWHCIPGSPSFSCTLKMSGSLGTRQDVRFLLSVLQLPQSSVHISGPLCLYIHVVPWFPLASWPPVLSLLGFLWIMCSQAPPTAVS